MKKIEVEKDSKLEIKKNFVKADIDDDSNEDMMNQPCTKAEVLGMFNNMYSHIYNALNDVYSSSMKKIYQVADQTNEYIDEHGSNHLPDLNSTQVKAVLKSCGIDADFEEYKASIKPKAKYIYATVPETLKDMKIEVK